MYTIVFTHAALKDFESLEAVTQRRVSQRIRSLSEDPRGLGTLKMSGQEIYRVRVGDYRIIYTIDDHARVVTINRIGHRRDVYR